jgi:DNA-directed RNA polymerase I subunit RPA2
MWSISQCSPSGCRQFSPSLPPRVSPANSSFLLQVRRDMETRPEIVNLQDEQYIRKTADRMQDVGQKFEYLLNTGNLVSRSGLDLSQSTGFTVVAEKLNYFR